MSYYKKCYFCKKEIDANKSIYSPFHKAHICYECDSNILEKGLHFFEKYCRERTMYFCSHLEKLEYLFENGCIEYITLNKKSSNCIENSYGKIFKIYSRLRNGFCFRILVDNTQYPFKLSDVRIKDTLKLNGYSLDLKIDENKKSFNNIKEL